jgi:hypothetical protein
MEEQIRRLEKEILQACEAVHPHPLQSREAESLWSRVQAMTRDERPYQLGGQQAFYEALDRLSERGCLTVNRGAGGMFEASITPEGAAELKVMEGG